ncbi:MAG: ABC transporter ATP-binding protein, partial [Longicatena sp.]
DIAEKESTILTIMNTDVYYIQAIISKVIPQVIIDIFSVVAVFIVLYQIQPIILYVIIIVYPTLVILQILFNKKIAKASRTAMNAIDKSNNLLQEYLKYMFDYISMNAHDYFMNKYFDSENQVFSSKLKLDLLNSYNSLVPTSINSFTLIIMILFCSMYIINGMMSISGLTIFIMYINKLFNPILRLMMTFGEFQKIKVSMQRINSILEVEE